MIALKPKNTVVQSPESNGIAEIFVKTMKHDYICIMLKPDGWVNGSKKSCGVVRHYNELHPHSALG